MLKVERNHIYITRGDTMTLIVIPTLDGEAYTPNAEDKFRFALALGYRNGNGASQLVMTKDIPVDTLTFTLSPEETKKLVYPEYVYDVELTHADGSVDTFISGILTPMGEVI